MGGWRDEGWMWDAGMMDDELIMLEAEAVYLTPEK